MGRPDVEVARALRVLRDHRQYREPARLPLPCEARLAEVAQLPLEPGPHPLGALRRVGAALSAAPGSTAGRPTGHIANAWPEEPGALIGHTGSVGGRDGQPPRPTRPPQIM